MSTTFALTSASALETPVIVIDTCIVGGDFDHFSYSSSSPFTPSFASPSLSSLSPLSPQSSVSNFLHIPRFFMTTSPSTRNLRVHRRNATPPSPVTPLTPVNSPASPEVRNVYLGVPDFGVNSPSVRCKGWSSSSSSSECECDGERAEIGRGREELVMSPIAPPNTPCSPLGLGRLERGSKNGEGGVLSLSESEREDSVDTFQNTRGYSIRERVFGDIPQIVVGCEEQGWGQLGVEAHAGMNDGRIVESWEMKIQLRN